MRKDDHILNFEGVQQSIEDIQRKFLNGVFEFYCPEKFQATPGKLLRVDGNQGAISLFKDGKYHNAVTLSLEKLCISREYPTTNLVLLGNNLYLLTKQAQRQWQRGTHGGTFNYEKLYGPAEKGPGQDVVFASAFLQKYASKEQVAAAIQLMPKGVPVPLRPFIWMVSTDGYMMSLYYEDMFIGIFNKDREFVGHSETETLAEEMIRELQLRPT